MKKAPTFQIEEHDGDRYPDRDATQAAAMELLAASLQAVIRDLLDRGVLVKVNGKIIPNPTMKP